MADKSKDVMAMFPGYKLVALRIDEASCYIELGKRGRKNVEIEIQSTREGDIVTMVTTEELVAAHLERKTKRLI